MIKLINGDCITEMEKLIDKKVKVDLVVLVCRLVGSSSVLKKKRNIIILQSKESIMIKNNKN